MLNLSKFPGVKMRTQVVITVDTEFSIGGAFRDWTLCPVAEQRVWCVSDYKSHGLGFMLDCFAQYGITATFFVEVLNRHYFKRDPMRGIAEKLRAAGHDVQLHLHPCWTVFQYDDWRERAQVRTKPGIDAFYGRAEDESLKLMEEGLEIFHQWGLPAPTVFRSGSLHHDDALYRAQARAGIPYSSHVGAAVFDSGDANYRLYSGRHERHGVIECPILTFQDWKVPGKTHLKSLTITGSNFAETRMLLEQAHREGIEQVVILTHPFEYVHASDLQMSRMRRHHVNQRRLARLCKFLSENTDRFATEGMATAAALPMRPESSRNVLLKGSLLTAMPRMIEQAAYDKYGQWRLKHQEAAPVADLETCAGA
jgi:peptidoglycan/xylan/chitin deacetylase (PgdA/CDA1 family)